MHFYHVAATGSAGNSMISWSQWTSATRTAIFARRIFNTGSLGAITRLGNGDRPTTAVSDSGAGLAVWQSRLAASTSVTSVYARRFAASGRFGPVRKLTSDGRVARVAANPRGGFSVVWQQASAPYAIRGPFGP